MAKHALLRVAAERARQGRRRQVRRKPRLGMPSTAAPSGVGCLTAQEPS